MTRKSQNMFYKIDLVALQSISEFPAIVLPYVKGFAKPWEVYNPDRINDAVYEKDTTLISASGANPGAPKPIKEAEFQLYPLNTGFDIRAIHIITVLHSEAQTLHLKTNILGVKLVPKLFEKLWRGRAYDFFRMLEEVEIKYSNEKGVQHKPFLVDKLGLHKTGLSTKSSFEEFMKIFLQKKLPA